MRHAGQCLLNWPAGPLLAHAPLAHPIPCTMRAHVIPCLAVQHSTVPCAPRRSSPCMPALPCGPLQLALRACNAGTIMRTITGQYYKALCPMRGHPESNDTRASPRYLKRHERFSFFVWRRLWKVGADGHHLAIFCIELHSSIPFPHVS